MTEVEQSTFLIKGAPILADIAYVRSRHGEEGLQQIYAAMSAEHAARYQRERILAASWYTMDFRVAILEAMNAVFGKDRPAYFFDVGAHQAEHNIKNFYKAFMKIVGPTMTIKLAKLFWSLIYKTSRLEVTAGDNHAELEVFEYPKSGVYNCHAIRGYVHRTAEISGNNRKNVRSSEVSCLNRGDATCKFVLRWQQE